jgi:hypothetical protein
MNQVIDYRKLAIESLTIQQIRSRLHLIKDEQYRLHQEQVELKWMYYALDTELKTRP